MIQQLRNTHKDILLVDLGSFFWPQEDGELKAEFAAKAITAMKYDVLNVAEGELLFGLDAFNNLAAGLKPLLIGSNLAIKGLPLWQPYIIKQVSSGLRVGVIGIASGEGLKSEILDREGVSLKSPVSSAKDLAAKIGPQVDLLVLLSNSGWQNTLEVMQAVPEINIAMVGNDYFTDLVPEKIGQRYLFKSTRQGKQLGIINIFLDRKKKIAAAEGEMKELSADIQVSLEHKSLETQYDQEKYRRHEEERLRREQKMKEEVEQFRKMSPQEFIDYMNQSESRRHESNVQPN